jgi:hypothetical protein
VVVVAANTHDAVAVDRHDDAARGRADPAIRKLVALHCITLRRVGRSIPGLDGSIASSSGAGRYGAAIPGKRDDGIDA